MIALDCDVQNYAWGHNGNESIVARLKGSSDASFKVNENTPYAELWMGTHPSGPSKVSQTGLLLSNWLKDKPDAVGLVPNGYPSNDLPFLFKVLCVKTALSIQAHPDKELAKNLHAERPNIYKDANHKPEMAIALTDFECLSGFRKISEIKKNLQEYPELSSLIVEGGCNLTVLDILTEDGEGPSSSSTSVQNALQSIFESFMKCPDEIGAIHLQQMIIRITSLMKNLNPLHNLLIRLNQQYPGDKGVFAPLILNYMCLVEGQSFYMGANEPHAYLSGDCIECMALSDNVVRAGLTPKYKDVETLCSMVKYQCGKPSLISPIQYDPYRMIYRPPVASCAEFEVERFQLSSNEVNEYEMAALPCGSIMICVMDNKSPNNMVSSNATFSLDGVEITIKLGSVVFISANKIVKITLPTHTPESNEPPSQLIFYRAHVNLGV